jgi:capsular polysaccharide biosynthesis protein
MSQQSLDLRRSVQIVRRHKILVGVVAILGLLMGAAYAVLKPPLLTGTALIVLPPSAQNTQSGQNTVSPYTETQVVVAHSDPVLQAALPSVRPAMSLNELRSEVQVNAVTSYIISVSARSKSAADAEATANAVAESYVTYVNSTRNPAVQVSARLLQPATNATGRKPLEALLFYVPIGAIIGALIGIIAALAIGRGDRRLRERDELANSIGIPVLVSIPVAHPANAAGWTKLFEEYEPGAVDGWRLRKALQQLWPVVDFNQDNGSDSDSFSLAVLSLSSDPGALALGPQLAVFAASQGISTTLLIGPQQDADSTATLRTACAALPPASARRLSQLRVTVADDSYLDDGSYLDEQPGSALTVVVVVVDGKTPRVPPTMRTTGIVLGVSAGAATAEQLARAAVSAAADGREILGILVADPEPTDRTTGRVPQLARPRQNKLPTRLRGMTTEIRR